MANLLEPDIRSTSPITNNALETPDVQEFGSEAPRRGSQPTPGTVEKGLPKGETYSKSNPNAPGLITTSTDPTLEEPPPDGGLQAWIQVAMGWIVIFATWGYINSFGAFQAYYTSVLSQSASQISWIGSIQTWLTFVIGAFSGRLLDAGFFVPTLVIGSVLQLLGIFLMSISTNYWHLMLTQGVLTGLGSGLFFTPALALISTYFKKPTGSRRWHCHNGQLSWWPRPGHCLYASRLPPRTTGPVIDWTAFKEPLYVCTVTAIFFMVWAVFFTLYYLGSFGRDALGMPFGAAAILITLVNGAGLPARILIPLLSDSIGTLNVISISCVALAITAFGWLKVHNPVGVYVFTVFYGISNGGYQALIAPAISSITPRMDMAGTRIGMCFTIVSVAGLTGPPVGGFILSASTGKLYMARPLAALSTALGATFMVVARMLRAGWKLNAIH